MLAHGIRPGDRVSLLIPPGADLTAVLYACFRIGAVTVVADAGLGVDGLTRATIGSHPDWFIGIKRALVGARAMRSEEHTSELQSRGHLVCRLLLEKKNTI